MVHTSRFAAIGLQTGQENRLGILPRRDRYEARHGAQSCDHSIGLAGRSAQVAIARLGQEDAGRVSKQKVVRKRLREWRWERGWGVRCKAITKSGNRCTFDATRRTIHNE